MNNKINNFELELKNFLEKLNIKYYSKEWNAASYFIRTKGLYIHEAIYKFLQDKLNNKREITYEEIATTFRYDKKLRNLLYKFIAMIEEKLISIISNFYGDKIDDIKIPEIKTKQDIHKNIEELKNGLKTNSIWQIFKNLDFYWTIIIFCKNAKEYMWKNWLFKSNSMQEVKDSLHKIRKLRNIVNHNKMLFLELTLDEIMKYLNAFKNVLSDEEWNSFKKKIEKCSEEDNDILSENWHEKQVAWQLLECIKISL